MKRVVILLLITVFIVGMASVSAENKLLTLEEFVMKFDEASEYVAGLYNSMFTPAVPKIGKKSEDGSSTMFTIRSGKSVIAGDFFSDTGVLMKLVVMEEGESKEEQEANQLKLLCILYAISAEDDFETSLSSSYLQNFLTELITNDGTAELNGYSISMFFLNLSPKWISGANIDFIGPAPSADSVLNPKTNDEYAEMYKGLTNVKGSESGLSSGEYIVGQHIPAGEYSASTAAIAVNLQTRRDGKLRINELLTPANPIGRMVLQDGDEIEISGGAVTFTPLQ